MFAFEPVALLDAANYAEERWDKVTDENIKYSFIKVDLGISLDSAITETFNNNELFKLFKNFNITATKQDFLSEKCVLNRQVTVFQ